MQPGSAPRESCSQAYAALRDSSPWDVFIDEEAEAQLLALITLHPILEGLVVQRLLPGLRTFPPDPRYFTDPQMSLGDPGVWITISEKHLRIRIKAEYRKEDQRCWVVHIRAEPV